MKKSLLMDNSVHSLLLWQGVGSTAHVVQQYFPPPPHSPLSLQVVYELPATSQWIFEVHWCPRNPSMISTASFDGHVTMYSLLGGGTSGHEEVTEQVYS